MKRSVSFLAGVAILLTGQVSAFPSSAAADYSLSSNPNGEWTYGSRENGTAAFVPFTAATQNWTGIPDFNQWGPNGSSFLGVYRNSGSVTLTGDGSFIPPGTLLLHPVLANQFAVVRWTAPADGTYAVNGSFTALHLTTTSVTVTANGTTFFTQNLTGTLGQNLPFSFSTALLSGQNVEFLVGANGNDQRDSTGLDAVISVVPEPSSFAFLAGVAALVGMLSRRRR